MASLFISYSRKDIEAARKLTEAFKGQDLDFWIDWEGIPPTVDWWKEIEKGIEETDFFLFLLSPDSAESKVCGQEIQHALKNGKRLIPIVVRTIPASEAPPELRPLNWIYLREEDNFRAGFSKVIQSIKTDFVWARAHRQLLVKALEWERGGHRQDLLLHGEELREAELQLATNSSKEPHPTDLQRAYVLQSRQSSDRRRRRTTGIAIATGIVLAGLAIFGLVQAELATTNARKEQAASTRAVANERIAVTNEAEAKRQADIALSRQLAAQAQTIMASGYSRQITAVLLAIRSMQILPSVDAAQTLQNNTLPKPALRMTHADSVTAASFSPDGRYSVSGGHDGSLRVWDAKTGQEVTHMSHGASVTSVAFSPDGEYVVSGGEDQTVRIWDAATGAEIAHMLHGAVIFVVAFDTSGSHVYSVGTEARSWDVSTGKEVAHVTLENFVYPSDISPDGRYFLSREDYRVRDIFSGQEIVRVTHDEDIMAVAVSTDGKYVVSGGCEKFAALMGQFCTQGSARVWEVASGKEITRVIHDDYVEGLAFSPDGKYILSESAEGIVMVWEATSGKEVARIVRASVNASVAFSPGGRSVILGHDDGSAYVWRLSDIGGVTRMVHEQQVTSVAFSPDGSLVVAGGTDGTARVWEAATGGEVSRMTYAASVSSVAFSPEGKFVVSGSEDKTVRVWDAGTGEEVARMTHDRMVTSIVFSPDGRYVVSGSLDGTARIWEAASGEEIVRMTAEEEVSSVLISADGRYVVSGGCDRTGLTIGSTCGPEEGTVRVWEVETGKEVARMTYANAVLSVAISPDSSHVVSASWDGTARVWEAVTGKEVARMTYDGSVTAVAFSPDGNFVVSGACEDFTEVSCTEGTVRIWEASTGREVTRMAQAKGTSAVAFSPDGKYVLSAECDKVVHKRAGICIQGTVHIWEAGTGKEVARMVHDDYVSAAAFSPDGRYVVSGSSDGTVRVWLYRPEDLIADACSRLQRNLTRAEWNQYIGGVLTYQAVCDHLPLDPEATPTP